MANAHKEWMAKISEIDEQFGNEARYPHTAMQVHIDNALENQNKVIQNSSIEMRDGIVDAISDISGSIEEGFEMLIENTNANFDELSNSVDELRDVNLDGFNKLSYGLKRVSSILDWGFSKISEQNRINNILLDDVIGLLNIPDVEKERKLYIEKGLNFFKKSKKNPIFFNDAKKFFIKALEYDDIDYFVNYNLGLIHLFSKNNFDLINAEKYFLSSALYSEADIMFENDKYSKHSSSFKTTINPEVIATYSFLYAARSAYMLNNYENSLKYILQASKISPDNIEVSFDLSKYYVLNEQIDNAKNTLSKIIDKDRFITLKILSDSDLINKKEIISLLNQKKVEAVNKAKHMHNELLELSSNNSNYKAILDNVNNIIKKNTFLDAKKAIDILN